MTLAWTYQARHAPAPAWPDPAKHDYMHNMFNLQPKVTFDRAYQVVAAQGRIYFGASADDKVYCLDATSGAEVWSFFTEGPVRLAPTVAQGKIYVGSDDGWVYCLDAATGTLVWKYHARDRQHRIAGNGRMISLWPVRSDVLVHQDRALFCAGIFPSQGVDFATLDAETGTEKNKQQIDVASQGYLMIRDGKLYTPRGRSAPAPVTDLDGAPNEKSLPAAPEGYPYAHIRAADTLFASGDNKIAAFRADSKEELWSAHVAGRPYGLSAADGRLFVSTDEGMIYCFTSSAPAQPRHHKPAGNLSPYPQDALSELYARAAQRILEQTEITKGYCLDLGCRQGRLAYEIAQRSDLKIIGVESNPQHVAAARQSLDEAGLYGRVMVHQGPLDKLPFGKYLFNLIISDQTVATGKLPLSADEAFRVLRPSGGVCFLGQPADALNKLTGPTIQAWVPKGSATT